MRARIRDTEIFFDVDGASLVVDRATLRERPTAFVVHGGPGVDHVGLKGRYGRLSESMQLVYFDQRGHGRSARGDVHKYTLDENVEDLEALRQYLGLGPIVSIGTSYGGRVALAHAARYPDSVSHLVLIATAAHGGSSLRARQIVSERGTQAQNSQLDDMYAGRIDTVEKLRRYFEVMAPLYSHRYDPQSGVGLGPVTFSPEPFDRAHGPGGFLSDLDLRPELKSISAPTLILAGRHDFICAPEFSEEMHRLIQGSELRIFEASGHSIGVDEPRQLLEAIAGFVVYNSRGTRTHT
jgi:proline iminopeptidase